MSVSRVQCVPYSGGPVESGIVFNKRSPALTVLYICGGRSQRVVFLFFFCFVPPVVAAAHPNASKDSKKRDKTIAFHTTGF